MVDKMAVNVGRDYQLDVDVNTVVFHHHHLFSREHVHASQLTRLYEEYVSRMRKRAAEFLTGKVSVSDFSGVLSLQPLARPLNQMETKSLSVLLCFEEVLLPLWLWKSAK